MKILKDARPNEVYLTLDGKEVTILDAKVLSRIVASKGNKIVYYNIDGDRLDPYTMRPFWLSWDRIVRKKKTNILKRWFSKLRIYR